MNYLKLIISLLNEFLALHDNEQVKECFENADFVMILISVMKKSTDLSLKNSLFRAIIKISVRLNDLETLKTVAEEIIQNFSELLKKRIEMDDLQMILSFLQELEKQNLNDQSFLSDFIGVLIENATHNFNSTGIEAIFKDFAALYCGDYESSIFKIDLCFIKLVENRVTDLLKLINQVNYQEAIVKILSSCLNLNKKEKEFMFSRFMSSPFEVDEKKTPEMINFSSFFNNNENTIGAANLVLR